jgi:hypothetical protein
MILHKEFLICIEVHLTNGLLKFDDEFIIVKLYLHQCYKIVKLSFESFLL